MGEQKPIQVELTEEELTELLRDLPPYNPDLRVSWQSCELELDSADFFAIQGGGVRKTLGKDSVDMVCLS
ncbi:MAG: hypothetical protein K0Q75_1807 [Anaerospora sp.]|nr:hypothetical protein [Anaerospora sp.]